WCLIDLVDRATLPIEELEAAALLAIIQRVNRGKAELPLREEDAQINIFAHDQANMRAAFKLAVNALASMHGGLIPRQRHHAAKAAYSVDNVGPFGAKLRHDGFLA